MTETINPTDSITQPSWSSYTTDNLIAQHLFCTQRMRDFREQAGRIEQELLRRLDAAGGNEYVHPEAVVKVEENHGYDFSRLAALGELIPPDVLATGFVPAHEETVRVADKWDMRTVLSWRKFGTGVGDVLDKARFVASRRLVVRRRRRSDEG